MNGNLTSGKKVNSFTAKTENRLEDLKQNYVAFQLPRNLNKIMASSCSFFFFINFRFKNLNFPFMHRVSTFTLSLSDSDT